MCTVSNIGDVFGKKYEPYVQQPNYFTTGVSQFEFDLLKKEVQALKELLLAAKKFDETTGQPDCHMDEKVAIIRKVAEAVGVNLDEVFGPPKP